MPEAKFDDRNLNLPTGGGKYIRLKAKGDKIKFLIANTPQYETKHWVSDREAVLCDKYNSPDKDVKCEQCIVYKDMLDDAGGDKEMIKAANSIRPQVTFFYPILNLKENTAAIFQTTQSVHWTIVGYADDGVDVFACAWVVERTEDPGNYYAVRRLDAIKLSADQKNELVKAKAIKLNKGKKSTSVTNEGDLEEGDDIPFPESDA